MPHSEWSGTNSVYNFRFNTRMNAPIRKYQSAYLLCFYGNPRPPTSPSRPPVGSCALATIIGALFKRGGPERELAPLPPKRMLPTPCACGVVWLQVLKRPLAAVMPAVWCSVADWWGVVHAVCAHRA